MSEKDCMRCEETSVFEDSEDYCPKCRKNMNRMDMQEAKHPLEIFELGRHGLPGSDEPEGR